MGIIKDGKEKRMLYNKQIELKMKFSEKYKTEKKVNKNKVPKELKEAIDWTIQYPKDIESFNKIDEYSFTNASLPKDKEEVEIYIKILNVVNYRINTDYANIMFDKYDTYRGNIFFLLEYIKDIKELDKDLLDKVFTILMHSNNLTKLEIMLDLLQSLKNVNKNTLKSLINSVYFNVNNNLLKVIKLLVEKVAYSSKCIFNDLLDKVVNNKELKGEQIDSLYNLIKVLEHNYAYSLMSYNSELSEMIYNTAIYIEDKNKLEYINKLLSNYNYITLTNLNRKTKIYDMCINTFDENISRNKEILCLIDNVLCMNIDDKIFDYIISKIYELNSSKSISILNNIYPVIEKYSNVENSINTINSIDNNGVITKKLVISIDKE